MLSYARAILSLNAITSFLIISVHGNGEINNLQVQNYNSLSPIHLRRSRVVTHRQMSHRRGHRNEEAEEYQISDESIQTSIESFEDSSLSHRSHQRHIHPNQIVKEKHCPECQRRADEERLTAETIRHLRLERIKEKILHKLRLKEPPNAIAAKGLPDPLISFANHYHHRVSNPSNDMDDYYGKTEQVIVFAEGTVNSLCQPRRSIPSTCLTFILPNEVVKEKMDLKVSSAELWVYTLEDDGNGNRVFTMAEISTSDLYNGPKTTSLDRPHTLNNTGGWESMNVSLTVGAWMNKTLHSRIDRDHPPLTLQIGCKNCTKYSIGSMSPIDILNAENRPFLVINMAETVQKNRRRRNTNCQTGPSQCCRESFKVNFSQIGYNWIIEPKEFDAFYCKGACGGMRSRDHHSSIMQAFIIHVGNGTIDAQSLLPCCSPTKLEGITILYTMTNSTSVSKYLPNMVVETCGCA